MVPESSALHTRPGEMRAALEFTAAETGFSQRIIEKDYWCSLVLRELVEDSAGLVFKGRNAAVQSIYGIPPPERGSRFHAANGKRNPACGEECPRSLSEIALG